MATTFSNENELINVVKNCNNFVVDNHDNNNNTNNIHNHNNTKVAAAAATATAADDDNSVVIVKSPTTGNVIGAGGIITPTIGRQTTTATTTKGQIITIATNNNNNNNNSILRDQSDIPQWKKDLIQRRRYSPKQIGNSSSSSNFDDKSSSSSISSAKPITTNILPAKATTTTTVYNSCLNNIDKMTSTNTNIATENTKTSNSINIIPQPILCTGHSHFNTQPTTTSTQLRNTIEVNTAVVAGTNTLNKTTSNSTTISIPNKMTTNTLKKFNLSQSSSSSSSSTSVTLSTTTNNTATTTTTINTTNIQQSSAVVEQETPFQLHSINGYEQTIVNSIPYISVNNNINNKNSNIYKLNDNIILNNCNTSVVSSSCVSLTPNSSIITSSTTTKCTKYNKNLVNNNNNNSNNNNNNSGLSSSSSLTSTGSAATAATATTTNKYKKLSQNNKLKKMVAATELESENVYDDDPSEELQYGPGIVSKLRCRYLSLALRQSTINKQRPSLDNLRRATSLNNLLDSDNNVLDHDDDDEDDEDDDDQHDDDDEDDHGHHHHHHHVNDNDNQEIGGKSNHIDDDHYIDAHLNNENIIDNKSHYGNTNNNNKYELYRNSEKIKTPDDFIKSFQKSHKLQISENRYRSGARGNDTLKRARSVETLIRYDNKAWQRDINREKSENIMEIKKQQQMVINDLINEDDLKTKKDMVGGTTTTITIEDKIVNARDYQHNNNHLHQPTAHQKPKRLTSFMDETERPPPDLVKHTLRIFEASANRRSRHHHHYNNSNNNNNNGIAATNNNQQIIRNGKTGNNKNDVASKIATYKTKISQEKQQQQQQSIQSPLSPTLPSATPMTQTMGVQQPPLITSKKPLIKPRGNIVTSKPPVMLNSNKQVITNGNTTTPTPSVTVAETPSTTTTSTSSSTVPLASVNPQSTITNKLPSNNFRPSSPLRIDIHQSNTALHNMYRNAASKLELSSSTTSPSQSPSSSIGSITPQQQQSPQLFSPNVPTVIKYQTQERSSPTSTITHPNYPTSSLSNVQKIQENKTTIIESPSISHITKKLENLALDSPKSTIKLTTDKTSSSIDNKLLITDKNSIVNNNNNNIIKNYTNNFDKKNENQNNNGDGNDYDDDDDEYDEDFDTDDCDASSKQTKLISKIALENISKAGTTTEFKFDSVKSMPATKNTLSHSNINKQKSYLPTNNVSTTSLTNGNNNTETTTNVKQIGVIRPLPTAPTSSSSTLNNKYTNNLINNNNNNNNNDVLLPDVINKIPIINDNKLIKRDNLLITNLLTTTTTVPSSPIITSTIASNTSGTITTQIIPQQNVASPLIYNNNNNKKQLTSREIEKNLINIEKSEEALATAAAIVAASASASGSGSSSSSSSVHNNNNNNSFTNNNNNNNNNSGGGVGDKPSQPALWTVPKKPKARQQQELPNTTMVFNFSDRKEIPDYLGTHLLSMRPRRDFPKPGESGFAIIGDITVDPDDAYTLGPPSPCDVQFENANVIINGKSSIRDKSAKEHKFRIHFNDNLTSTFEYPSENSLIDDFGEITFNTSSESTGSGLGSASGSMTTANNNNNNINLDGGALNTGFLGNIPLGSASPLLGNYTPTKGSLNTNFELGITRTQTSTPHRQQQQQQSSLDKQLQSSATNGGDQRQNGNNAIDYDDDQEYIDNFDNRQQNDSIQYIKPATDEQTVAWSEGTRATDLLF